MSKIGTPALAFIVAASAAHAAYAQQAQRPQLPLSYGHAQQLKNNADEAKRLGAALPAVAAEPGPPPPPPLRAPAGYAPAAFSSEPGPEGAWCYITTISPGGAPYFGQPPILH